MERLNSGVRWSAGIDMTSANKGRSGNSANEAEVLLLRRVADHDRAAFDELFESYYSRLFSFLFR